MKSISDYINSNKKLELNIYNKKEEEVKEEIKEEVIEEVKEEGVKGIPLGDFINDSINEIINKSLLSYTNKLDKIFINLDKRLSILENKLNTNHELLNEINSGIFDSGGTEDRGNVIEYIGDKIDKIDDKINNIEYSISEINDKIKDDDW